MNNFIADKFKKAKDIYQDDEYYRYSIQIHDGVIYMVGHIEIDYEADSEVKLCELDKL